MIINKITTGFVIQRFDTKTKKLLSQEFVAGDEVTFENQIGMVFDSDDFDDLCHPIELEQQKKKDVTWDNVDL